jgi:hypothetical protein
MVTRMSQSAVSNRDEAAGEERSAVNAANPCGTAGSLRAPASPQRDRLDDAALASVPASAPAEDAGS